MIGREKFGVNYGTPYLLNSNKKVLIETGTSLNATEILNDLSTLNIEALDYIAVTHLHLDHVGGAGFLVEEFPESKVIVHESGVEHLINPDRLKKSASRALKKSFEEYGELKPIPRENIKPVSGREEINLGLNQSLKIIHTPGHAPHHICFYETKTKSLAVGDIAGMYNPNNEKLFPATPPPNFHLEKTLQSLEKLQELELNSLLYTHYSWTKKPYEKLEEYSKILRKWVTGIKKLREELGNDELVKEKILSGNAERFAPQEAMNEISESEIAMDIRGVLLYLDSQKKKST